MTIKRGSDEMNSDFLSNPFLANEETKYDLSKIGKYEYLGRHVRVESDNSVHFDTGVGKVIRQVIGKFTGNKPNYVKDLGTKINILNHATSSSGNERVGDISKILAKSIVREHHNNLSDAPSVISKDSITKISIEEHKLVDKLKKDPIINALIANIKKSQSGVIDSEILSELEKQGVDLKKTGIDVDRFVEILADKTLIIHPEVSENVMKLLIKNEYNNIRSLESDPRVDPKNIKNRSQALLQPNGFGRPERNLLEMLNSRPGASTLMKHLGFNQLESYGVDLQNGTINIDKFAEFRYQELFIKYPRLDKESCIQGIKKRCMEIKEYESSIFSHPVLLISLYEDLLSKPPPYFLNFRPRFDGLTGQLFSN